MALAMSKSLRFSPSVVPRIPAPVNQTLSKMGYRKSMAHVAMQYRGAGQMSTFYPGTLGT